MYSVVLATVMAVNGGGTGWNCHGCWGFSLTISVGGHGCYSSCYGCSGCYGSCYGCSGCYGSCYGYSAYYGNCYGYSGCFGCYGCSGCYGPTVAYYVPQMYAYSGTQSQATGDVQREMETLRKQVESLKRQLEMQKKNPGSEEVAMTSANKSSAAPAQVTIRLPADAKLYIDDVVCPLTSDTRSFATPVLQPGQKYYYMVRVEMARNGKTVQESQRVVLEAGQPVSVTFPSAATVTAGPRP